MNYKDKNIKIIKSGFDFLHANKICKEDKIIHLGRRSYIWPIINYLFKKTNDKKYLNFAKNTIAEYSDAFRRNSNKDIILYPGLNNRYNYSTNAIDCGIFLDSIIDLKEIINIPKFLDLGMLEIFNNYAINKLEKLSPIHNQYLWLLSGFTRILKYSQQLNNPRYKILCKNVLDNFCKNNNKDGSCSYSNLSKDLKSITPYYHSRCFAFMKYSINNLNINNDYYNDIFLQGASFLANIYNKDFYKILTLETKRYYFHNLYEVGSTPYDIYVFQEAYKLTKDKNWLKLSKGCINQFFKEHDQKDRLNYKNDWQCETMRKSHIAWLCRLDDEFFNKLEERLDSNHSEDKFLYRLILQKNYIKNKKDLTLLNLENNFSNIKLLKSKSPLSPLNGIRSIGIQPIKRIGISNILDLYPYEYRSINIKAISSINNKIFLNNIKRTLLHFRDCIFNKRNYKKAFEIIIDHFFSYIIVSSTTMSSSFPLDLQGISKTKNSISHYLEISDTQGLNRKVIGQRTIILKKNILEIIDYVTVKGIFLIYLPNYINLKIKNKFFYKFKLKEGIIFIFFNESYLSFKQKL